MSRSALRLAGLQPVERLDQLVLPEPGVGVVLAGHAHLGDRGEGQQPDEHGHHGLAARRREQRVPQAGPAAGRVGSGTVLVGPGSGMEEVPPDRGHVGEDPDAEDHDHAGGELARRRRACRRGTRSGRDQHVADEGDHEDLVVEDAVEEGPEGAEHGVERGDHRDRQVGLEASGTSGLSKSPSATPMIRPMMAIIGASSSRHSVLVA